MRIKSLRDELIEKYEWSRLCDLELDEFERIKAGNSKREEKLH